MVEQWNLDSLSHYSMSDIPQGISGGSEFLGEN